MRARAGQQTDHIQSSQLGGTALPDERCINTTNLRAAGEVNSTLTDVVLSTDWTVRSTVTCDNDSVIYFLVYVCSTVASFTAPSVNSFKRKLQYWKDNSDEFFSRTLIVR